MLTILNVLSACPRPDALLTSTLRPALIPVRGMFEKYLASISVDTAALDTRLSLLLNKILSADGAGLNKLNTSLAVLFFCWGLKFFLGPAVLYITPGRNNVDLTDVLSIGPAV